MLIVSERWKQNIERDDRQCRGYISLNETIISDDLFSYKIKDSIYDDDFIGSFVKKRCDVEVLNKQNKYLFDNAKIDVYAGLHYDDDTDEYLNLGTYVVMKANYDNVNNLSTLECYDLSTLFDVQYKTQSTFPCTLKTYLTDICNFVNVPLSELDFNMQDIILSEEPYLDEGSTFRDAVRQVCKTCLSCAQIIDNKLVIKTVNRIDKTPDFMLNDYFELSTEAKIGPYNVLTLSRVPQEDNYVFPDPLPENPIEYRVENNVIIDKHRELYAPIMYQYINGLTFTPCSVTLLKGRPEITALDYFTFIDMEELERQSIVFTHEFTFDGNFSSIVSCTSKSQNQTDYKRAGSITKRVQTTELWVDKAKGEIQSLISKTETISDDLENNYSTTEEMENVIKQTIEETTNLISKTGGFNLIENSQFYQNLQGWETSDNTSYEVITGTSDVEQNTVCKSELKLINGSISKTYSTIIGKEYTIAFKYKKQGQVSKNSYVRIYRDDNSYISVLETDDIQNERKEVSLTYIATVNTPNLVIYTDSDDFYITDLVIQPGTSTEWSPNANETRGLGHTLTGSNLNIYDVSNSGNNVLITPINISFYLNNQLSSNYGASDMSVNQATIKTTMISCGITKKYLGDDDAIES